MSLVSISHHLLDRLSIPELERLSKIAAGLSGKTIPIGSTCSGLATTGLCVKALFQAINERFQTNIQASTEFAVEINPQRQNFILEAHGDQIRHLFSDVRCFKNNEAYCLREKKLVPIPLVFLLVGSPSCVNLSGQRTDRADFASCYEGDSGCESAVTYHYGYKEAVVKTEAQVSIFENIRDVASALKDRNKVPQKPAVDIITEDARLAFKQSTNSFFPTNIPKVHGTCPNFLSLRIHICFGSVPLHVPFTWGWHCVLAGFMLAKQYIEYFVPKIGRFCFTALLNQGFSTNIPKVHGTCPNF